MPWPNRATPGILSHRHLARPPTTCATATNPLQRILTLAFNNAGQVAFYGTDSSRNNGLWAQDRAGVLRLIALSGQQIDVDDGPGFDLRTIVDLQFVGGAGIGSGRGSGFNDLGQIAFLARFTDGTSGVFVSNAAAVPELPPLTLAGGIFTIYFSMLGRGRSGYRRITAQQETPDTNAWVRIGRWE